MQFLHVTKRLNGVGQSCEKREWGNKGCKGVEERGQSMSMYSDLFARFVLHNKKGNNGEDTTHGC